MRASKLLLSLFIVGSFVETATASARAPTPRPKPRDFLSSERDKRVLHMRSTAPIRPGIGTDTLDVRNDNYREDTFKSNSIQDNIQNLVKQQEKLLKTLAAELIKKSIIETECSKKVLKEQQVNNIQDQLNHFRRNRDKLKRIPEDTEIQRLDDIEQDLTLRLASELIKKSIVENQCLKLPLVTQKVKTVQKGLDNIQTKLEIQEQELPRAISQDQGRNIERISTHLNTLRRQLLPDSIKQFNQKSKVLLNEYDREYNTLRNKLNNILIFLTADVQQLKLELASYQRTQTSILQEIKKYEDEINSRGFTELSNTEYNALTSKMNDLKKIHLNFKKQEDKKRDLIIQLEQDIDPIRKHFMAGEKAHDSFVNLMAAPQDEKVARESIVHEEKLSRSRVKTETRVLEPLEGKTANQTSKKPVLSTEDEKKKRRAILEKRRKILKRL